MRTPNAPPCGSGRTSNCCWRRPGRRQGLQAELDAALQGLAHSLVDVSQRQSALLVSGPRARDLLASGCPLDLDPEAFPAGMCARTLLAKAEVVLWRRSAEEYHLEVARSFSGYVLEWMREVESVGLPIVFPGEGVSCRSFVIALLGAVACGSQAARADQAETPPAPATTRFEEVVVTAQRREQNIQDVGIAVTPLGEKAL